MAGVRIVDVVDEASFGLVPPCADPSFDHRSCDYWEDADRGSRAARASGSAAPPPGRPARNPFGDEDADEPPVNPFLPASEGPGLQPVRARRRRTRGEPVRASAARPRGPRAGHAAQARPAVPGPGDLRELRQGPARRRRAGRLRAVRAAVGVPARVARPRALPAAPGRPAARGHHLHRHDRARRAARVTASASSPRSATTWPVAASRRSRPIRRPPATPTRRAPRPRRSGWRPASAWPSTTTASR